MLCVHRLCKYDTSAKVNSLCCLKANKWAKIAKNEELSMAKRSRGMPLIAKTERRDEAEEEECGHICL